MKIAIMQPYVFPYIGYFQLINAVDVFVLYDDVNYIKKGFINRNNILINGCKSKFTIPCKQISQNILIKDIELLFSEKEKSKFLKKIQLAYQKAPFFTETFEIVKEIINSKEENLSEFIIYSLQKICNILGIQTNILISSDFKKNNKLSGQDKIVEICKKSNANVYINAIGGLELYNKQEFLNQGIELNFLQIEFFKYKQFNSDFVSGLSIIDVFMFNSIENIKLGLNQYKLI